MSLETNMKKNGDKPMYNIREVDINEDDIPAKEETEIKSSWLQSKNENRRRKKSTRKQKSKRKKGIISLGRMYCDLFFYNKTGENE